MAAALAVMVRTTLRSEFKRVDPLSARIVLVDMANRVLGTFDEKISDAAKQRLERLGVEVRLGKAVEKIDEDGIIAGGERIASKTVIWTAGVTPSPAGKWLAVETDRAGRVKVQPDCSVPGHPEIFVVGDLAVMTSGGIPVPGVAQGAIQSGRAAARNVLYSVRGEPRRVFRYRNKGDMATIGRHKAIGDFGHGWHVAGYLAWWLWVFIHIMYLAGFRNRLSVILEWAYSYFTYGRGARLITGWKGSRASP